MKPSAQRFRLVNTGRRGGNVVVHKVLDEMGRLPNPWEAFGMFARLVEVIGIPLEDRVRSARCFVNQCLSNGGRYPPGLDREQTYLEGDPFAD